MNQRMKLIEIADRLLKIKPSLFYSYDSRYIQYTLPKSSRKNV